jgi:hypothetical protein
MKDNCCTCMPLLLSAWHWVETTGCLPAQRTLALTLPNFSPPSSLVPSPFSLAHMLTLTPTVAGLNTMTEKFKGCDFGRCPRVYCNGQPCLPVGLSDIPRQSTVKLFCPKCEDVYYPRSKYHGNLDGGWECAHAGSREEDLGKGVFGAFHFSPCAAQG